MSLRKIAKNGPKTQLWLKVALFDMGIHKKRFFVKKMTFGFLRGLKKCHFKLKCSFWPIFGNVAQWHFFNLARKQKAIFFTKEWLLFTEQTLSVAGKIDCSIIPKQFGKLRPIVEDLKTWFFVPLRGPFWCCDSLLLKTGPFYLNPFDTLWQSNWILMQKSIFVSI